MTVVEVVCSLLESAQEELEKAMAAIDCLDGHDEHATELRDRLSDVLLKVSIMTGEASVTLLDADER
jgi:hypothetical protein